MLCLWGAVHYQTERTTAAARNFIVQTPWEELAYQLIKKLATLYDLRLLPYSLDTATGLAKGTKMWIKIQISQNNIYVY
jgi:hypothetical protein